MVARVARRFSSHGSKPAQDAPSSVYSLAAALLRSPVEVWAQDLVLRVAWIHDRFTQLNGLASAFVLHASMHHTTPSQAAASRSTSSLLTVPPTKLDCFAELSCGIVVQQRERRHWMSACGTLQFTTSAAAISTRGSGSKWS